MHAQLGVLEGRRFWGSSWMVEGNFTIFQNRVLNGITSKRKKIILSIVLR